MEMYVGENRALTIKKLYVGITLELDNGKKLSICQRDGMFELSGDAEYRHFRKDNESNYINAPCKLIDECPVESKGGDGCN